MSSHEGDMGKPRATALLYADDRARAAAQLRAYVARMLRDSEADNFAFMDDVT